MLYGVGKLGAKAKSGAGAGAVVVTPGVSGPETNSFEFDLSKAEMLNDSSANYNTSVTPYSLQFNADGTKLFYGFLTGSIYEVTLSTAYDIRTATGSETAHSMTYDLVGIKFADSGTKLYTSFYNATGATDAVVQYDLTTGYDLTTASYTRQFNVKTATSNALDYGAGIEFKPDGTKMFVYDLIDDAWYEFSLSTAFDISTASYTDFFDLGSIDTNYSPSFSADGTKMYYYNDGEFIQRTMSTAWDVSTAGAADSTGYRIDIGTPYVISSNPDGTLFYAGAASGFYQSPVTTAKDITTVIFDNTKTYRKINEGGYYGIFFKPDGTKMYYIHSLADKVFEVDLSVAWDITSGLDDASLAELDISGQEINPHDLYIKPDGTEMYQVGTTGDDVNQWTLSTAWDITSATYTRSFSVSALENAPRGITFKSDGTKMYISGTGGDKIHEYDLSTAWDISTASLNGSSSTISNIYGIVLNDDGTKIYVALSSVIKEYTMSTAYDITTISETHSLSVRADSNSGTTIYSLYYKPDGTRLFIGGFTGIREYATDSKKMVEQIYSPAINVIESLTSEVGISVDYTGDYDVLNVQFIPDSAPSDFSGRLYIGYHVVSRNTTTDPETAGTSFFFNDFTVGALQILNSSEARVHAWQGNDFTNWETTTAQHTVPSAYTDVTALTYSSIASGATAQRWNVASATGSTYTGAADGVSTTYGSGGSAVLPVRGLHQVAQTASTDYCYVESSSPVTGGDFIWMRSPSVTLSSGLHNLRIAYNLTSQTPANESKTYNALQVFWAGA